MYQGKDNEARCPICGAWMTIFNRIGEKFGSGYCGTCEIWMAPVPTTRAAVTKNIRVTYRDGNHVDVPCEGRSLRIDKSNDTYVIVEDKQDGKHARFDSKEVACFPCDVVQSIIHTTK